MQKSSSINKTCHFTQYSLLWTILLWSSYHYVQGHFCRVISYFIHFGLFTDTRYCSSFSHFTVRSSVNITLISNLRNNKYVSKVTTSTARILGSWVSTRLGAEMFFYLLSVFVLFLQIESLRRSNPFPRNPMNIYKQDSGTLNSETLGNIRA